MAKFKQQDTGIILDELENDLQRVRRLYDTIATFPGPGTSKNNEELEQLLTTIRTASYAIRGSVRDIEQAVKESARESDSEPNRILTARLKRGESQFTVDEAEKLIQDGNVEVLTQGINEECEHLRKIFAEMDNNPKGLDIVKMEKCWKVVERHQMLIDKANSKLGIKSSLGQGSRLSIDRDQIERRISQSRVNMLKSQEAVYPSKVVVKKNGFLDMIERIPLCIRLLCVICINLLLIFLIIIFLRWTQTVSSGPWFQSSSNLSTVG